MTLAILMQVIVGVCQTQEFGKSMNDVQVKQLRCTQALIECVEFRGRKLKNATSKDLKRCLSDD